MSFISYVCIAYNKIKRIIVLISNIIIYFEYIWFFISCKLFKRPDCDILSFLIQVIIGFNISVNLLSKIGKVKEFIIHDVFLFTINIPQNFKISYDGKNTA